MHQMVPDAVDTQNKAIALAISRSVYGMKGYVGRRDVLDALIDGGMTQLPARLEKQKLVYPDNVRNGPLLNMAIQAATALEKLKLASFDNRALITGEYDDLGLTDYDDLAFRIFGFNVEALYYAYFLLLGISLACFTVAFRDKPFYLAFGAVFSIAHYLVLASPYFNGIDLGTVHNQRFLSVLAVLPFVHISIELIDRRPSTLVNVGLCGVQLAMLLFAMTIRGSSLWALIAIALLAAGIAAVSYWGSSGDKSVRAVLATAFKWPLILVLVGLAVLQFYRSAVINPVYQLDDFIPHRMTWHSAYLGLAVHPDWQKVTGRPAGLLDSNGYRAAQDYLARHIGIYDPQYGISPLSGTYKFGMHEKVMRLAYVEFVRKHPVYFAELMLFWKPIRIVQVLWNGLAPQVAMAANSFWRLPLGLAILGMIALSAVASPYRHHEGRTLLALLAVGLPVAMLPPMWAFPASHTMGEQLLFVACVGLFIAVFAMAAIAGISRRGPRGEGM